MTIERKVLDHNGKVIEVTHLMPGCLEDVYSSNFLLGGEELSLHVDTDDQITLTFAYVNVGEYRTTRTERESVKLAKGDINAHTIKSHPTFLTRHTTEYKWIPTHLHLDPNQEKAIKELVEDGTYTPEIAEEVREQMIEEKRRKMDGLDTGR